MTRYWVCAAITFGPLLPAAAGIVPSVIFSNIAASPSSEVPGMPGFRFFDEPSTNPTFGAPMRSPNGRRWIFRTQGDNGQIGFRMVLVGENTSRDAAAIVALHNTPTFFDSGVNYTDFRPQLGINDAGSFAFGGDTNAPTNSDEIAARGVLVGDGETQHYEFNLIAREGVPAPDQPPGVGFGSGARWVHILNDDTVAFISGGMTGSGGRDAIYLSTAIDAGQVLVQGGVTIPDDQAVPGTPLDGDITEFRIDATGQNYAYTAFLSVGGAISAVNNSVVLQTGRALPGGRPGYFPYVDWGEEELAISRYNGHYTFRNPISTASDAVIIDDAVVAVTGDPIVFGSSEIFGDNEFGPHSTFVMNNVNSHGDYVLVGHVNIAPTNRPQVCVWNRRVILFREDDPVDLNGDGLGNDGFYLGYIDDDYNGYITDHGRMYFVAQLRDTPGGPKVGEAFLWLPVPNPGDPNCDGVIDFFDVDPFLLALFDPGGYAAAHPDCFLENADLDRSGRVDFFDIDPFVACLFGACP